MEFSKRLNITNLQTSRSFGKAKFLSYFTTPDQNVLFDLSNKIFVAIAAIRWI